MTSSVKLIQEQETVRGVLHKVITQLDLPVSRLFLENPSIVNGVTMGDYFRLHLMANDPCMRLRASEDGDVTMEVRDWLTTVRRELVTLLGQGCLSKGVQFEDIIVLNTISFYQILPGVFEVNKLIPYRRFEERIGDRELHNFFLFLEDLSCLLYALPADDAVQDFLSRCHAALGIARITLKGLFESFQRLSVRSDEADEVEVFEHFKSRIIFHAEPRLCERGFEQFNHHGQKVAEMSLWRGLRGGKDFLTNDSGRDSLVLRELRIPEPLIELHNPSTTLFLLQETVRNLGDRIKEVALLARRGTTI